MVGYAKYQIGDNFANNCPMFRFKSVSCMRLCILKPHLFIWIFIFGENPIFGNFGDIISVFNHSCVCPEEWSYHVNIAQSEQLV